jgi:hypothetical protein
MGANAKEFLLMRMNEEGQIEMPLISKTEIKKTAKKNAEEIAEKGEQDLFNIIAQTIRLEEYSKEFNKHLRECVLDELKGDKHKSFGCEFSHKNGGKRLNYEDDKVYFELKEKLKEREQLLKLAHNSKDTIYDNEGVEVPKVTANYSKDSLNIKF